MCSCLVRIVFMVIICGLMYLSKVKVASSALLPGVVLYYYVSSYPNSKSTIRMKYNQTPMDIGNGNNTKPH